MIKTNYHTHTKRCLHAEGNDLDYINEAIKANLHTIGFSDHGPYEDNRFGLRMPYSVLPEYIKTFKNFKKQFKDIINIKIGLEIEYDENKLDYYKYLLTKLDYLALGQHIFLDKNNNFLNSYEIKSTESYLDYANSISKALDTKLFSFVAHPDLIFLNEFPFDENCEKACNIIINAAKRNNSILEFNANGFRRGIHKFPDGERYQYPYKPFWEKVKENNLMVLVSSDCHNPKQVYDSYMEMAVNTAKDFGLNVIDFID